MVSDCPHRFIAVEHNRQKSINLSNIIDKRVRVSFRANVFGVFAMRGSQRNRPSGNLLEIFALLSTENDGQIQLHGLAEVIAFSRGFGYNYILVYVGLQRALPRRKTRTHTIRLQERQGSFPSTPGASTNGDAGPMSLAGQRSRFVCACFQDDGRIPPPTAELCIQEGTICSLTASSAKRGNAVSWRMR